MFASKGCYQPTLAVVKSAELAAAAAVLVSERARKVIREQSTQLSPPDRKVRS